MNTNRAKLVLADNYDWDLIHLMIQCKDDCTSSAVSLIQSLFYHYLEELDQASASAHIQSLLKVQVSAALFQVTEI